MAVARDGGVTELIEPVAVAMAAKEAAQVAAQVVESAAESMAALEAAAAVTVEAVFCVRHNRSGRLGVDLAHPVCSKGGLPHSACCRSTRYFCRSTAILDGLGHHDVPAKHRGLARAVHA